MARFVLTSLLLSLESGPMNPTYDRECEVAIRAVREASLLCRSVGRQIAPEVLAKKDRSPVTVADFGSQALVCRVLAETFPADPVIAEEDSTELRQAGNAELRGRVLAEVRALRPEVDEPTLLKWIDQGGARAFSSRFWTLDPIDGTKGFLRSEQYAIALALIVDGTVAVAAMACPNLALEPGSTGPSGAIFVAVRGRGASVRPIDHDAPVTPIHVSPCDSTARARFCESVESGHSAHGESAELARRLGIASPPVRLDSQAKYAVVARGEAEIYLRLPTRADYREKIWDHAAGVLVVEEAGGRVTDVSGRPLEFHHGRELSANRGVVVSNGPLHERIIEALNARTPSSS